MRKTRRRRRMNEVQYGKLLMELQRLEDAIKRGEVLSLARTYHMQGRIEELEEQIASHELMRGLVEGLTETLNNSITRLERLEQFAEDSIKAMHVMQDVAKLQQVKIEWIDDRLTYYTRLYDQMTDKEEKEDAGSADQGA
jgi:hypothetical protein